MTKAMKNMDDFTDREWQELASILSEEKEDQNNLLGKLNDGDGSNYQQIWKDLKGMNSKKEIDVDHAWDKVRSRLAEDENVQHADKLTISFVRTPLFRIAATVLLLIGIGLSALYIKNSGYFSSKITVVANNDQNDKIVSLPDGSKVYLNRNSEFTYRKNFGVHSRNVSLTGEAFFEIAPDKSKPFLIDAGKATVKVVGTSFNVITNNSESAVEVFVKTGKVMVSDNTGQKSIQLDPGYIGTVNSNSAVKTINTNANYLSWKTGHLDYSGQKLSVVFNDLKRVYNMDIVADDPSILDNPWHSPIDNSSQETIIRIICTSFNLSYTREGNTYHLAKK